MLTSLDGRVGHALAQISGQTDKDAFDTFWGEADAGEIGDGAGGEAGAVVEPEDAAVAISIKGGATAVMKKQYELEQKNGKWVVSGRGETAGHGTMMPGTVAPGTPNPHAGIDMPAPGAGGKMPSPEDLPPAGKKK